MTLRLLVLAALACAVAFTSCGNRDKGGNPSGNGLASLPAPAGSGVDECDLPRYNDNVDSSFYDFIYLFKSDSAFQRSRTAFPLDLDNLGKRGKVEAGSWQFDSLLLQNVYYTLLNDNEQALDTGFDMNAHELTLREVYTGNGITKNYHFAKDGNKWFLRSIAIDSTAARQGTFLSFYERFANDSAYQMRHVGREVGFVTYDNGDEMSLLEATISRDQWKAFRPSLAAPVISGFDCTTTCGRSQKMIVTVVKIETGYNIRLYFRHNAAKGWMLYKYEDLSV